jgi:uncharacterized protein Yka (UPF0111/DUF47 family)
LRPAIAYNAGVDSVPSAWRQGMLGWFRALLPREDKFFELFIQHSEIVVAGAEALRAMLEGGEAVPRYFKIVMDREQDADNITRDILIAVRRTFITPFDRGDIKDLITSMDNSIDQMQKTAKSVMLFDIRTFTPCMREMGDAVVKCALLMREAMPLLREISPQASRLTKIAEEMSAIEGRADDLHDTGLRELFQKNAGFDPMAFITGNEVYDHLEKVVDRFDDVANRIHGVVIDHV